MANVQYKVKKTNFVKQEQIRIMTVNDVLNGEAVSLETENDEIFTDFIHASSVPVLEVADKVIVQTISNFNVITDKIRNSGEKPTVGFEINEDGSISLFSEASIVLKTLHAKIDILDNGKILIDGSEVYSLSKGVNRIQGTTIELN